MVCRNKKSTEALRNKVKSDQSLNHLGRQPGLLLVLVRSSLLVLLLLLPSIIASFDSSLSSLAFLAVGALSDSHFYSY